MKVENESTIIELGDNIMVNKLSGINTEFISDIFLNPILTNILDSDNRKLQ